MYGYHYHKDGTIKNEKDYLSYSAINLWRKDRKSYRSIYYLGKSSFTSVYTVFGSGVHKLVEDGSMIIDGFPTDEYEHEVMVKTSIDNVKMIAYIDLLHKTKRKVIDIKTGKSPWTATDVQKLDQLPYYVLMLRENGIKASQYTGVLWLETQWVEGESDTVSFQGFELERTVKPRHLALTGKQVYLSRRVYLHDLDRVRGIITSTAREIESDFTEWCKKKKI